MANEKYKLHLPQIKPKPPTAVSSQPLDENRKTKFKTLFDFQQKKDQIKEEHRSPNLFDIPSKQSERSCGNQELNEINQSERPRDELWQRPIPSAAVTSQPQGEHRDTRSKIPSLFDFQNTRRSVFSGLPNPNVTMTKTSGPTERSWQNQFDHVNPRERLDEELWQRRNYSQLKRSIGTEDLSVDLKREDKIPKVSGDIEQKGVSQQRNEQCRWTETDSNFPTHKNINPKDSRSDAGLTENRPYNSEIDVWMETESEDSPFLSRYSGSKTTVQSSHNVKHLFDVHSENPAPSKFYESAQTCTESQQIINKIETSVRNNIRENVHDLDDRVDYPQSDNINRMDSMREKSANISTLFDIRENFNPKSKETEPDLIRNTEGIIHNHSNSSNADFRQQTGWNQYFKNLLGRVPESQQNYQSCSTDVIGPFNRGSESQTVNQRAGVNQLFDLPSVIIESSGPGSMFNRQIRENSGIKNSHQNISNFPSQKQYLEPSSDGQSIKIKNILNDGSDYRESSKVEQHRPEYTSNNSKLYLSKQSEKITNVSTGVDRQLTFSSLFDMGESKKLAQDQNIGRRNETSYDSLSSKKEHTQQESHSLWTESIKRAYDQRHSEPNRTIQSPGCYDFDRSQRPQNPQYHSDRDRSPDRRERRGEPYRGRSSNTRDGNRNHNRR